MRWIKTDRFDPLALPLADRHYNRQHVGSPQFVPPGKCFVLRHEKALWVTSWPMAEYVRHAWAGAWVNSMFRNEGAGLSSELIQEAIAATRWNWPEAPTLGLITFVDETKIRRKRDPGRCYIRAGFHLAICPKHAIKEAECAACESRTKGGLLAFQMFPHEMPSAEIPLGVTERLLLGVA
jgi:hypothetical protein